MDKKEWANIGEFVNIGTGIDLTVKQLVETIRGAVYADVSSLSYKVERGTTKSNGTSRKLLVATRLNLLGC